MYYMYLVDSTLQSQTIFVHSREFCEVSTFHGLEQPVRAGGEQPRDGAEVVAPPPQPEQLALHRAGGGTLLTGHGGRQERVHRLLHHRLPIMSGMQ